MEEKKISIDLELHRLIESQRESFEELESDILKRVFYKLKALEQHGANSRKKVPVATKPLTSKSSITQPDNDIYTGSKPKSIVIDGEEFFFKSWAQAYGHFLGHLLNNNARLEDLLENNFVNLKRGDQAGARGYQLITNYKNEDVSFQKMATKLTVRAMIELAKQNNTRLKINFIKNGSQNSVSSFE